MPNWKKVIVSGSDAHLNTLELTNTTTNDSILITSTDAGSSAAPVITLKRNSGSPADSDYLGQFKFKGENDADQEVIYSKITGKIQDQTDGEEDGIIEFSNMKAGTQTITARLKSDKLELINSTSLEVDGGINLPDDAVLNFGDGNDLQIHHDGSNSFIKDAGTGGLFYRGGTQTFQNAAGSKTMMVLNAANSVDLNFNDNTKFQTTNTGVSVTGNVVASGNISGSSTSTGSFGHVLVDGTTLSETISDTVGAMVGSNTETGISVTYQDGDNTLDFALDAAQTTITSLLATDIKIGEDDQTKIDFGTANEINFAANNQFQIKLTDGVFKPVSDSDVDLGQTGARWKDAYIDTITTTGNVSGSAASTGSFGRVQASVIGGNSPLRIEADNFNISTDGSVSGSATSTGSFGHLVIDKDAHIGEDLLADGDVVAFNSSDMRLKNNLQVIGGALDKIDGINGYEFDWNEQSPAWAQERGHDVGVVAQEIEKIHPEIVEERKNGYLGVDYKRLVPLLIQSVKELKAEVEELKKKV